MSYSSYIAFIPLLPLAGFLLLGLFGKKYLGNLSGIIGVLILSAATLLSIYTAYNYFFVDGLVNGRYLAITPLKYTWLTFSENLSIDMGIMLDPISVMMLVVVTFVSLMVHIFSLGYMKGEERYSTYFAYLSLFTFSMLGLVVSTNIFQIYMFWELVGVSSYLLIGYYFDKPSAVAASKKAFIVTRFADLGFLIGILLLGLGAGSLDFATIISRLTGDIATPELTGMITTSFLGVSALTWALTLIFIGGAGKSAMFPLHIWLPDAMEGPTPVSALIHAATMVVAGVFLVARLFPVFANDPAALQVVMWIGITSAVFAAVIACTQTDIKRVLAYSTMSQIGYMMFALGVSGIGGENGTGYIGSLFHLFTHAFFKSLLFLGAGAVIHMVHSNDMNDMGGLKKYMPVTHITFLIACLAIAGVPPFSGFFSKEEILLAAWNSNKIIYVMALLTSGVTAFYMFRLYFNIFFHKEAHLHDNHGEGSLAMKLPLILLAILTLVTGFVPFSQLVSSDGIPAYSELHLTFSILPVLLAITGIATAYFLYFRESEKPSQLANGFGVFYKAAYQKFYIDEVYLFITQRILFNLIGKPAAWIDKNIIDGTVNLTGNLTVLISELTRGVQSGKLQSYALYFLGGIITLTVVLLYLI
ncbi:MAG: NADH-quinone oxidoreductase subunit L [Bacteroidetes bacterium]|nr:NADH-quinone oxidoreductase subunit L [Bacteroidota bacterium]